MSTIAEKLKALGVDSAAADKAAEQITSASGEGVYLKHKESAPFEVVGKVTSVWSTPGYKGVGTDPGVAIAHDGIPENDLEAGVLKVSCGLTSWKNQVAQANPQAGDVVVLLFGGLVESKTKGGSSYYDFRLTVAQRALNANGAETAPF
jgi:hypothetical protein